ncbi:MAG: 50S ribosomal protein L24 [Erysipelotrichaceae bacterium]|jgi:large subunit ribosomal protein L24|nr:50S ribosomal protein L24 [Erysipelotrichaceae bacterium]
MKIKKGDKVKVIAGDDKGVVAEVVAALPRSNRVIVEGVNVVKRHTKPNNANPDGGIINKELPISVSNVKLVDDKKKKTAKKPAAKKTAKKNVKGDKK